MNTQIIVCDLGGVLIDLHVERCMNRFRQLMGNENMQAVLGLGADGEGVTAVSVAQQQLMVDFERGNISADNFVCELQRHCHPSTTKEDVIDAWMSMLGELPQKRLDCLNQLKQEGKHLYLLSNGNDLHFNYINNTYHLDTYFERMFLSQELHLAKPEREIFELVEQTINPDHKPVLFFDDLDKNRQAAEQYVHWNTAPAILNEPSPAKS